MRFKMFNDSGSGFNMFRKSGKSFGFIHNTAVAALSKYLNLLSPKKFNIL
jgi:hypothetical protein